MFIAQAATEVGSSQDSMWQIVLPIVPWLAVFVILFFVFLLGGRKRQKMIAEHLARERRFMDAIESKLDRLIQTSEQHAARDACATVVIPPLPGKID